MAVSCLILINSLQILQFAGIRTLGIPPGTQGALLAVFVRPFLGACPERQLRWPVKRYCTVSIGNMHLCMRQRTSKLSYSLATSKVANRARIPALVDYIALEAAGENMACITERRSKALGLFWYRSTNSITSFICPSSWGLHHHFSQLSDGTSATSHTLTIYDTATNELRIFFAKVRNQRST